MAYMVMNKEEGAEKEERTQEIKAKIDEIINAIRSNNKNLEQLYLSYQWQVIELEYIKRIIDNEKKP